MCNNFNELPACLTVKEVQGVLRVSEPVVYEIVHREDFPAIRLGGRRYIIPKNEFIDWLHRQVTPQS